MTVSPIRGLHQGTHLSCRYDFFLARSVNDVRRPAHVVIVARSHVNASCPDVTVCGNARTADVALASDHFRRFWLKGSLRVCKDQTAVRTAETERVAQCPGQLGFSRFAHDRKIGHDRV